MDTETEVLNGQIAQLRSAIDAAQGKSRRLKASSGFSLCGGRGGGECRRPGPGARVGRAVCGGRRGLADVPLAKGTACSPPLHGSIQRAPRGPHAARGLTACTPPLAPPHPLQARTIENVGALTLSMGSTIAGGGAISLDQLTSKVAEVGRTRAAACRSNLFGVPFIRASS
jgi:hypothetical protein